MLLKKIENVKSTIPKEQKIEPKKINVVTNKKIPIQAKTFNGLEIQ